MIHLETVMMAEGENDKICRFATHILSFIHFKWHLGLDCGKNNYLNEM